MSEDVASLFLGHSRRKLIQMADAVDACLDRLDDQQVWHRFGTHSNSVGNLLLHLAGNLDQWIGHTIAGRPDTRDRAAEFRADGGQSREQLRLRFRGVIETAERILAELPPERLTQRVVTQDGERSVLEVVYQVVGHVQQHTGQILFATKQMTDSDLNLYKPPSKPDR